MSQFDAEANLKPATGAWRFLLSLGLFGLSCALPVAASAANTLHLTGTHRTATENDYVFAGHYDVNHYNYTAERVGLAIKGKYVNRRATETLTIFGPTGQATFSGTWSCAKDPWLNPSVSCIAVTPQASVGNPPNEEQDYFVSLCNDYPDGYCFLSRKLVPADVAKLMRDGPPAPGVSGVSFTHHAPVNVALHYVPDRAEHFYVDEWYCPPGKDAAPSDIPNGEPTPSPGEACKNSVRGPIALNRGASSAIFGIGKPAGQPDNGTWYVRASLDSASYGRSLWGHWHKTNVQLPMHFKDAPNNKPVPDIVSPANGYIWTAPNAPGSASLEMKMRTNIPGPLLDNWTYDLEVQRQRYVTTANAETYQKLHKGGFPTPSGALEAMHPWLRQNKLLLAAYVTPQGPEWERELRFQELRSNSLEYSYRYRFRVRENGSKWSTWSYLIVQETPPKSIGMRRSASGLELMPAQPLDILTPTENQIFTRPIGAHEQYEYQQPQVQFKVRTHVKKPTPDHWRLQWEWRQAKYYTKTNNDMYYCKYGQPKKNEFPRQTGVVPPLQIWDVHGLWDTSTVGTDGLSQLQFGEGVAAPNSTLFSYLIQFRVRLQRVSPEAYGPWSPWRSFIVENTGFNKCRNVRAGIKLGGGGTGIPGSGQASQQSGQQSQQRAAPTMRIGTQINRTLALHQQGPAMHTMSGSLHPSRGRGAPRLTVLSHSISVDPSCTNLAGFITIRETVRNDGASLPAGRAKLYVKRERGGAYLGSRTVPVPALAHGARATLVLKAGTSEAYRGRIPGRHVIPVVLDVNGRTTTTDIAQTLGRGLCRLRQREPHPASAKFSVKLNPQPEPPSVQRRLAIPHR